MSYCYFDERLMFKLALMVLSWERACGGGGGGGGIKWSAFITIRKRYTIDDRVYNLLPDEELIKWYFLCVQKSGSLSK